MGRPSGQASRSGEANWDPLRPSRRIISHFLDGTLTLLGTYLAFRSQGDGSTFAIFAFFGIYLATTVALPVFLGFSPGLWVVMGRICVWGDPRANISLGQSIARFGVWAFLPFATVRFDADGRNYVDRITGTHVIGIQARRQSDAGQRSNARSVIRLGAVVASVISLGIPAALFLFGDSCEAGSPLTCVVTTPRLLWIAAVGAVAGVAVWILPTLRARE